MTQKQRQQSGYVQIVNPNGAPLTPPYKIREAIPEIFADMVPDVPSRTTNYEANAITCPHCSQTYYKRPDPEWCQFCDLYLCRACKRVMEATGEHWTLEAKFDALDRKEASDASAWRYSSA